MKLNKKLQLWILTIIPGLLLWASWPPRYLFFLAFFAFVPFFVIEQKTASQKGFFRHVYWGLFLFNLLNTWWVWYASAPGAIVMLLANSWLMYLPWWAYRKAKQAFGIDKALFMFITFWLSFEYLHLNWEITWPWLTLGNVFAKNNSIVQWYEFTGVLGGSLWVLITNVLAYQMVLKKKRQSFALAAALVIPLFTSTIITWTNAGVNQEPTHEVLLVQPNVDPYKKFDDGSEVKNLSEMLALVEPEISDKTSYVVMPETAVVEYIDEDNPNRFESIRLLKAFVKKHPQIHLITGVSSYNFYDANEKASPTARKTPSGDKYESYNTAIEIDSAGNIAWYHKSKLVPGVEKMPYPKIFGFLEYFSIDMGGISGSLGSDNEPTVFDAGNKPNLAPLICYESVFPGWVSSFTRKGAEILLVITNDGWWKDTDGYKQHKYYATLRAIENRRQVLRSANTGISCIIDKNGRIQQETNWWEPAVLKVEASSYNELTFYAKMGDYLGRFAAFIGVFALIGALVKLRTRRDV
jgi:apolipoprotein N-acyltransferase